MYKAQRFQRIIRFRTSPSSPAASRYYSLLLQFNLLHLIICLFNISACGVLETVRISAAGFPSRLTYEEFIVRYRVLFHSRQCQRKLRDLSVQRASCETVLATLITEEDKFKFGASKIFFRAGQVAYLEKRRTDKLRACGILIQRMIRGWFYRKRYVKLRLAVVGVQRFCRGYLARCKAQRLRETRSAIVIQKHVRGFLKRRSYTWLRQNVLRLQTYGRGFLARKKYLQLVCNAKAVMIQKSVRGFLARRRYLRARKRLRASSCCSAAGVVGWLVVNTKLFV